MQTVRKLVKSKLLTHLMFSVLTKNINTGK